MSDFQFTPALPTTAGFSIDDLNELRLFMNTAVGNGNLPGAVLFLARGDKVVLHEAIGFSDIGRATALKTDDLFRVYSMTKPFTAVGMLLLYEEGRWRFDDPVSVHLPELVDYAKQPGSRASREPTLRELFTHGSGHTLGATMEDILANIEKLDLFGTRSLSEMIDRYSQIPPAYEPGTHWEYSIAMDLQAAIIERITGQRFDLFMKDRVFKPLGMNDTGFALTQEQQTRLVPGYAFDAETQRLRQANDFEMQELVFPMGGSSFRSTALDYARFARMLLNRGSLGDRRLLKPETVDLIFTNMVSSALLEGRYSALHYTIGGGNGQSLNGMLCIDPVAAKRPVGKNTYEWGGAHGTWFWADPEHDIVFVGMTHRLMPHPEIEPLSVLSQELVYRALQR